MQQNKSIESGHYEKLKQEYKSLSMKYRQGSILQYFNLKMKPTEDPVTGCYSLFSFFSVLDFLTVNPTRIYVREDGSYKAADDTVDMFAIYSRFLISALEELLSRDNKLRTKRILLLVAPYGMGKTHFTRLFLAYSMKLKKDEDINLLEIQNRRRIPMRFEIDYLVENSDFEKLERFFGESGKKISLLAFMLRDPLGWHIFDSGRRIAENLRKLTDSYLENLLLIIPASPLDLAYLEKFQKEFLDEYVHVILVSHYKNTIRDLIEKKLQYISSDYENSNSLSILEKVDSIRRNIAIDFLESSAIAKLMEYCNGNPTIALNLLERSLEITLKKGGQIVSEETMDEASAEMKLDLNKYRLGLRVRREREGVGRINYLISLLGSSERRAGTVSKITGSSVARVSTLFREIEGLKKKGRVYSFTESLLASLEGEIIEKIVNEDLDEFSVLNNLQKELNTEKSNNLSECPKGVDDK